MVPESHSEAVIAHVRMVHESVGEYSKMFLQKLRRSNYVTPKNYLDFISTYVKLLEDKDNFILGEKKLELFSQVKMKWNRSQHQGIGDGC